MPSKPIRRSKGAKIQLLLAFLSYLAAASGVSMTAAAADPETAPLPSQSSNPQFPDPDALPTLDPQSSQPSPQSPDSSSANPQSAIRNPQLPDPVKKLWEIPVPDPVTSAPNPDSQSAEPPNNPQSAIRNPQSQESPDFRNDPIARTALNNAQSNAASFTNGVGGFGSFGDSAFLPAFMNNSGAGFVFGPATIHPSLNFGTTYEHETGGTGINSDNGFHPFVGGDFTFSAGEPALRRTLAIVYIGQYLYDPNNSAGTRPYTQRFALRGNYGLNKLNLGFGITYQSLSGDNRDLAAQANQDYLTVAATATCELTPKVKLDLDVAAPFQWYSAPNGSANITSTANNTSGVTVTSFLNYESTPKTLIGIGVAAGLTDVQGQDAQRFGQLLGRGTVAVSPELSFSATFGVELRDIGDFQKITPVFGVGATWTPRLGTSFALTADRRTEVSSAEASQNFITTSVALSATQRLGSWMQLRVSFGFEDAQYYSTGDSSSSSAITITGTNANGLFTVTGVNGANTPDRHDQLYIGQVSLIAELTRRWSALLQYSYTKNISNSEGAAFDDTHAQFQFNYNF